MFVNQYILGVNPFFDAYLQSDLLGKLIFIGLIALSILTWMILIYKVILTQRARKNSLIFASSFSNYKGNLLNVDISVPKGEEGVNPFFNLYQVLKKQTVELLNKNRRFGAKDEETGASFLSLSDVAVVESHLMTTIASEIKFLDKYVYALATIVSLGPFLGLLGTVWGILTTFSDMQAQTGGNTSQMVLGGLSLALTTTVLGLLDAIPALIGYNYLKNDIRNFETDMQAFSNGILASVEMQYRKVELN